MLGPLSFVNSSCVPICIYVQLGSKLFFRSLRSISAGDEITVKYIGDYFGKENIDCLCPHPEAHGHGIVVLQSRTRAKAKISGESEKIVSNCLNGKHQSSSLRKSLGKTSKQAQSSKRVDNLSGRLHSSRGKQFRSTAIENFGGDWDWSSSLSEKSSEASVILTDGDFMFDPNDSSQTKTRENDIRAKIKCSTPLRLENESFNFDESTVTEVNVSPDARSESSDMQDDPLFEGSRTSIEGFHQLIRKFVETHKLPDNAVQDLLAVFKTVLPTQNFVPHRLIPKQHREKGDCFKVLNLRDHFKTVVEDNRHLSDRETVLHLGINNDGINGFKSRKSTFWPFWVVLNNLPPRKCLAFQNICLAALWKGSSKPNFSEVDPRLREVLLDISSGLYSSALQRHFEVNIQSLLADLPAKSAILNVVQFNGYFGLVK